MDERQLRLFAETARQRARIEAGASPCCDILKVAEYLRAAETFDREAERIASL